MPDLLDLPAPAKLNLFLHVVGRRADGYHLLESVFALTDWHDTLHLESRADGLIRRHDLPGDMLGRAPMSLPTDDLCVRAARLLQDRSGVSLGCDIHLRKNLPSGAGLGGGSSDAATVLLGLNHLWGLHWPLDRLASLGLQLGADVPFFIHGKTAWVSGIGEQITPLPTHPALAQVCPAPVAILKPPVSVPTPAIFGSPVLKRDTAHAIVADFLAAPQSFGRNDLQGPAVAYVPADHPEQAGQLTEALVILQNRFGNSRMTGSGSAVFAWVDPADTRPEHQPSASLTDLPGSQWLGRVCRTLDRHPLHERLSLVSATDH